MNQQAHALSYMDTFWTLGALCSVMFVLHFLAAAFREGSGIKPKAKVTLKKPHDPRDGKEPPDLASPSSALSGRTDERLVGLFRLASPSAPKLPGVQSRDVAKDAARRDASATKFSSRC